MSSRAADKAAVDSRPPISSFQQVQYYSMFRNKDLTTLDTRRLAADNARVQKLSRGF